VQGAFFCGEFVAESAEIDGRRDGESIAGENTVFTIIDHPARRGRKEAAMALALGESGVMFSARELVIRERGDEKDKTCEKRDAEPLKTGREIGRDRIGD
jgi:hypothetical protein